MGTQKQSVLLFGIDDFISQSSDTLAKEIIAKYTRLKIRSLSESEAKSIGEVAEVVDLHTFSILILHESKLPRTNNGEYAWAHIQELGNLVILLSDNAAQSVNRSLTITVDAKISHAELTSLVGNLLANLSNRIRMSEEEWLKRIDYIFRLSTEEIRTSEAKADAFQTLVDFEGNLRLEQEKISRALLALQEYRDSHHKDWEAEKNAREALAVQTHREMLDREAEIKARDNLLHFSSGEVKILKKVIEEIRSNGSINKESLKSMLSSNENLLSLLES